MTIATKRVERDATIHVRAPRQTKDLIEAAAASIGKTLSEFTLDSARRQAVDVLLDQRLFVLDEERFTAFARALDNPPAAGAKLKALMKRRPLWES
ncbi:MAG TPA: DUF1778 domain-containing protein [Pseudolabrys sp.]|nr:DUF1778 domain-containing protein [Pseudolabrys sp.]